MINRDPARTGADLWRQLKRTAGLQFDNSYDEGIVRDIADALCLPSADDLDRDIERVGSSPTEVLVAVLGAVQPWAEMMRDLLRLMETHGINRSRTQLRAEVDVGVASQQLDLDLRDFAEAITKYEWTARRTRAFTWTIGAFGELASIVPSAFRNNHDQLRPGVRNWLDRYEPPSAVRPPDTAWPVLLPPPPACGDRRLDRSLKVAWAGCERLLKEAAEVSRSRADLDKKRSGFYDREGQLPYDGPPTPWWIAQSDTDRLLGILVAGLDDLARRVREGDELTWGWQSDPHSPQNLVDLIDRLPTVAIDEQTLVERVRHLLSLPVWKHRYDIYSNWVFTQIVAALEEIAEVEVHHEDGAIDFGTDNTKLASIDELDLTIYCELRSKLVGTSEVRKHEVKPDYSMLRGSGDPKVRSVLEVECKQFKSADRKKFVAALQDYARSRTAARVVLVNYGPVTTNMRDNILMDVDHTVADRCEVISEVRPLASDPADLKIRNSFFAELYSAIPADPATRFRLPVDVPLQIDLFWDEGPPTVDLDLHLELVDPIGNDGTVVSFMQRSIGKPVNAHLEADVRQGPGPETLHVDYLLAFIYRLWVHRYDEKDLAECNPRVDLAAGTQSRSFACPGGRGPWWCVFEVDGATRVAKSVAGRGERPGWV